MRLITLLLVSPLALLSCCVADVDDKNPIPNPDGPPEVGECHRCDDPSVDAQPGCDTFCPAPPGECECP
jgi:hypothetical protein